MPNVKKKDLPGTIERSPAKAQRTFANTLESAHEEYDSEERAHRTAIRRSNTASRRLGTTGSPRTRRGRPTNAPTTAEAEVASQPAGWT